MKHIMAILFLLLASIGYSAPLQKITVKNAVAHQAVCNDGSPAIYYFRTGTGTGINRWVIFLVGGAFCYSVGTCDSRSLSNPELMTSNGKPETIEPIGLLSDQRAQNQDFYNANHVFVDYCSSDFWSGNREESDATGGYEFRGYRIVRAVVADLKTRTEAPNLKNATEVLLAGTSAGGVGVMMHLDWLSSQLRNAKVRGLNDAGWFPENFGSTPSMEDMVTQGIQLWNGNPDSSCAAANASNKNQCYLATVRPYLVTPLFVHQSQWDSYFLFLIDPDVFPPFDTSGQAIADALAAAVRGSLTEVDGAFSPRVYPLHALSRTTDFNSVKVNGRNLRMLLGNWFFNRRGPIKVVRQ